MKTIFRTAKIIALFAAAVAFSSCDNLIDTVVSTNSTTANETSETTADGKVRLCVSLGEKSARTILPADVTAANITRAELLSKASGAASASLVKEWSSKGTESAIGNMTADTDILIDAGTYDFTLNLYATFNGAETLCQTGTLASVAVAQGSNALAFSTKYAAGKGNLSVTLTWTVDDRIATVQAGLFTAESGGETAAAGYEMTEIAISGDEESGFSATYAKNDLANGTYFVRFELFSTDGTKINTLEDVAKIAAACTTSKTVALSNVNTIYAITYNLNGGTWATDYTAPKSRNANNAVLLTTAENLVRTGYDFTCWYTSAGGGTTLSENAVESIGAGEAGDVALWAKWTAHEYAITYELGENATNASENPATYTIESETITLAEPTKTVLAEDGNVDKTWEAVFIGWYEDETFESEAVTQIAKGSIGNKEFHPLWLLYKNENDWHFDRFLEHEEIGDIVFEDGRKTTCANYSEHKNIYERVSGKPIGIVAFKYSAPRYSKETVGNGYGAGDSSTGKWYMVGLEFGKNLSWCTEDAKGYDYVMGRCYRADNWKEVKKDVRYVEFKYTSNNLSDYYGGDNWEKMKARYQLVNMDDTDDTEKYLAFAFANTYGETIVITGDFAEGWYIPSIVEHGHIETNISVIIESWLAIVGDEYNRSYWAKEFWSSSSYHSNNYYEKVWTNKSGHVSERDKKTTTDMYTLVVRSVKKDAYKTE